MVRSMENSKYLNQSSRSRESLAESEILASLRLGSDTRTPFFFPAKAINLTN